MHLMETLINEHKCEISHLRSDMSYNLLIHAIGGSRYNPIYMANTWNVKLVWINGRFIHEVAHMINCNSNT